MPALRELTGGAGADIAVEAVGVTPGVRLAIAAVRKGGQVTLVGNVSPQVELPLQAVVSRELTLHGSCASCGEYPACLDLIAQGTIDVDCLTSAVAWFQRLYQREPGLMKVILEPRETPAERRRGDSA